MSKIENANDGEQRCREQESDHHMTRRSACGRTQAALSPAAEAKRRGGFVPGTRGRLEVSANDLGDEDARGRSYRSWPLGETAIGRLSTATVVQRKNPGRCRGLRS
ncbi:hypothetical protein [Mesorhizobium erdmanii]|uniref:hypothetical protein n=1 Tax=Mesorhizobium erdmanii TaxID=1777866 RepID=UPI0012B5363C|nr:hypothetical protein [Mesorhizobium erdmanii]